MSSENASSVRRVKTAAWRISLWSGVAFAVGTAVAFYFLQAFVATDTQNRSDAWLTGELAVLSDVAQRTPQNRLHEVVIREVAELASHEVPRDGSSSESFDRTVFFLATTPSGELLLETGAGRGADNLASINKSGRDLSRPSDVQLSGFSLPFRVVSNVLPTGEHVYLGLSTAYERRVLGKLRREFALLWSVIITLGIAIVFISTRRMLHRVQLISETASMIGRSNLSSRVPLEGTEDEIAHLSLTFNHMLDRIETSVQQLHTMSDSLAHDLRSPMTSMRGKLELALMGEDNGVREEAIISTIEELDRLSDLFSTSLDLSEATADALRLRKESLDLEELTLSMIELYDPSFTQIGLRLIARSSGPLWINADPALMQRMLANLLDNALKYTRSGSSISVELNHLDGKAILSIRDDGIGFPSDLLPRIFERYVKGAASKGHGLGLAFVAAVVRSHGGQVRARNLVEGGCLLSLDLPLALKAEELFRENLKDERLVI